MSENRKKAIEKKMSKKEEMVKNLEQEEKRLMENIIEQAEKVNSKNLILEDIPCSIFHFN